MFGRGHDRVRSEHSSCSCSQNRRLEQSINGLNSSIEKQDHHGFESVKTVQQMNRKFTIKLTINRACQMFNYCIVQQPVS